MAYLKKGVGRPIRAVLCISHSETPVWPFHKSARLEKAATDEKQCDTDRSTGATAWQAPANDHTSQPLRLRPHPSPLPTAPHTPYDLRMPRQSQRQLILRDIEQRILEHT